MVLGPELVGRSASMRAVEEDAMRAARSDAKVLLTGESGVGKEIIAKLVHQQSARRTAPFVTINCAGVPDTLLESELFGHERGSFTGAYRDKPGLLEVADHGTVFLDEIGEMSVRMQGMLLRFLETGELQRVGATRAQRHADVRVIAATNRVLLDRVREGNFREDLYYRLNVIQIIIPPLRDRPDDVLPLMAHFLATFAAPVLAAVPVLTDAAREVLVAYRWPGNVRELRNLAERLVVRGTMVIDAPDLNLYVPPVMVPPVPDRGISASRAAAMFARMTVQGESFWMTTYAAFMARDMTRDDLRAIVRMGLEATHGNYKLLVRLFNMDPADYKRFVNFLRKHHCHLAFPPHHSGLPSADDKFAPSAAPPAAAAMPAAS